jgi:hypothetical protein
MYEWDSLDFSPQILSSTFNDNPGEYFIVKGQYHCCDDEVDAFNDPIDNLKDIIQYEWVFHEPHRCDKYQSVTYIHDDDVLIAISCKYDELPEKVQMLVFISEDYFIIVGIACSHPFVVTPYLNYYNVMAPVLIF